MKNIKTKRIEEITNYDPGRWGFTFLKTDSRISPEDRVGLVMHATEMYLNKESERKISGEEYEGLLYTRGKSTFVSSGFSGQEFYAEIDTNDGKRTLSFLVTEHINPELN
ncbi:Uncharacterised protein [uncultured archaeon]|nr:Uncharacterised protein [uncultured archaeon]